MYRHLAGAVAAALSCVILLSAGGAAADYGVVTSWNESYRPLSKATELAGSASYVYGSTFGFTLPDSFAMRFYGEKIGTLNVSGNGAISFSSGEYIPPYNYALPYRGSPYGMIAPWWDEWMRNNYSNDPNDGGIFYKIEGSGDREVLKVEWLEFPYYYCYGYATGYYYSCDSMKHFSFQAWIYESDGVNDSLIQFHYAPIHQPDLCQNGRCLDFYETYYGYSGDPYDDLSGTIGVENKAWNQSAYGLSCQNNCRLSDWPANKVIMFGQPSGPELLPTMKIDELVSGQATITLNTTTTLRNVGAAAASGVTYAYYLSKDQALQADKDVLVGTHAPVLDVASNTTTTIDDSFVADRPAPGWYYACLFADSGEVASEAFEDNNQICNSSPSIVGVDFSGTISAPDTAGPGDDILLDLSLSNLGNEHASVNYEIVLARQQKPGAGDIVLYSSKDPGQFPLELDGQQSYTLHGYRLLIPPDALGSDENEVPRFILVIVDPDGELAEADETNNVLVSNRIVLVKPDLRVSSMALDLPDGACFFGRPVTVTLGIDNTGAARARNYDNALVLSDNGVITSYDRVVRLSPAYCGADEDCAGTLGAAAYCDQSRNSCTRDCETDADCANDLGEAEGLSCFESRCRNVLAAYDSSSVTFTGVLPTTDANGAPLADGRWYFGGVTDFYDVIAEGSETNNARPAESSGIECHNPAPDFVAIGLQTPPRGAAGEQLAVRRAILNRGNLDGTATWKYFLSSNPVISSSDMALPFASGQGSIDLDAGASDEATDLLQLPSGLTAGSYHVGIVLDPDGLVPEISEANNVLTGATRIDIQGAALRIATSSLPPATVEVSYVRQLVATGGAGAYTWSASSTLPLPPGMRLSSSGELTGKPTEMGNNVFGVKVQSGGSTAEGLLYLEVLPVTGALTVSTDVLPAAYVDVPYRVELAAVGGVPPYGWSLIGRPPQGISLKNNTLTGTAEIPDGSGDPTTFRIMVKDGRGTTAERELTLAVLQSADLSIQTTRIQDGLVGQPYQQIIRAAGGEPPYDFAITGLEMTGLASNANSDTTALVSGIPDHAGFVSMRVEVTDQTHQRASQQFKFAISGQAIQVQSDRALPVAVRGRQYPDTQLVAGAERVEWEVYAGEMPAGVTLSADGLLSGTVDGAAAPRTYTFLVRAYDRTGGEGFGSFSILLRAEKLPLKYRITKTGCGGNAAGGQPTALLLLAALVLASPWRAARRRGAR